MRRTVLLLLLCAGLIAGCGSGSTALGWQLTRVSGSTITVDVTHDSCDKGLRTKTTQTSSSVTVTVSTRHPSGNCAGVGLIEPVTVTLEQPLGGRSLHGCRVEHDCSVLDVSR